MNLYHPDRPKINGRPAFLNGMVVIPPLNLWPRPDGSLELSIMLPIEVEPLCSKWYRGLILPGELIQRIAEFNSDPESMLESFFASDPMRPSLCPVKKELNTGRKFNEESLEESTDLLELESV